MVWRQGLELKNYFSTQPHAAGFNKKENGDKKKGDKKQNKGKQKRTVKNDCGVVKGNDVEKLLAHNKKIPEQLMLLRDADLISFIFYQPHDGTAHLSRRSSSPRSVIRLIICFFIFIFCTFSCVYLINVAPFWGEVKRKIKISFFTFLPLTSVKIMVY